MKTKIATLLLCAALSPALFAAEGSVQKVDGNIVKMRSIEAETLSGIEWKNEAKTLGTRVEIWEVDQVRYQAKGMDEFNGLAKKMRAGKGEALEKDAQAYVTPPKELGDEGDKLRVKLTALYFVARAKLLLSQNEAAATAFLAYMKECEDAVAKPGAGKPNVPESWVRGVAFDSPTGNKVAEAGMLHRLYLDALEGLGDAYARAGNNDDASKKGFEKLVKLTSDLNQKSSRVEYFDWAIRGLKAAAAIAEGANPPDYKLALKRYDELSLIALKRNSGKRSRESIEANLKAGFIQVKAKELNQAQSRFSGPIREWETKQGTKEVPKNTPPANGWIDADTAYQTAGCYLGDGMVRAASAKDSEAWGGVLKQYSNALAFFSTDNEFHALALVGAAGACAELAKLAKDKAVAARHAETGDRYLLELRNMYGQTKAAQSPEVAEITKVIEQYKLK